MGKVIALPDAVADDLKPLRPAAAATPPGAGRMNINAIKVGKRHRKELGDIDSLAQSIRAVGLLHPVVVRPDGQLIAGERRLRACQQLGMVEIPTTVVDIDQIVRGEFAENQERKNFTLSEAVAIKREIEPELRAEAKVRQGRPGTARLCKLREHSRTDEKAAKATGRKARTLAKAEAFVAAAEADPRHADLVESMNTDDNADRAFRELRIREEREAYESRADAGARVDDLMAMAAAGRKFSVIYADPPWQFLVYSGKGKQRSAERHYDTSSLEAIKALPVEALAADDCALFIWGVWPELPGILDVIRAWGFEYKTCAFVWVKQNPSGDGIFTGLGYWSRSNSEFCLLATRGSPLRLDAGVSQIVLEPHPGEHSRKPEEARKRIERLLAGPYLELFARAPAVGWTCWGNELSSIAEAAE
jgi:N6-adenosine-specific RNA methylase IME4